MQDAAYLRTQAELCLQMACQLHHHNVVQNLRAAAARYFARALEFEGQRGAVQPISSSTSKGGDAS